MVVRTMRDSSLYIAISGSVNMLDKPTKERIELVFSDIFNNSAKKVSEVEVDVDGDSEMIYEIPTPIIKDDILVKEFFEDLEVLLEELKDFKPHFTQFKRGDIQ